MRIENSYCRPHRGRPPPDQGAPQGKQTCSPGAHRQSTFNNTIISSPDPRARCPGPPPAPSAKVPASRPRSPPRWPPRPPGRRAMEHGMKRVDASSGSGSAVRPPSVRSGAVGLEMGPISDVTPVPHNGCRPPSAVASDARERLTRTGPAPTHHQKIASARGPTCGRQRQSRAPSPTRPGVHGRGRNRNTCCSSREAEGLVSPTACWRSSSAGYYEGGHRTRQDR